MGEVKKMPFSVTDDMIPEPTGFRILVGVPQVDETYGESGIIKSVQELQREQNSSVAVQVIALGPDAYKDKEKFPTGPWCAVGDWVLIQSYAGTRFKIKGKELFRLINDDTPEAVVGDPRAYSRI